MAESTLKPQLSERAQHLLKTLVECYIAEGQPVGSRTLTRTSGLELSPATIRNVMSDLEDMGLVHSPHTSAGRVPTPQGYRMFVDNLLTVQPLDLSAVNRLKVELDPDKSPKALVEAASTMLSGISRLAGVVTLPRRSTQSLRQVEFLPLSDHRVLAILVINEREVQNRIIHMERDYSSDELRQAANYLNAEFAGKDLQALREQLLGEMRDTRAHMDHIMQFAIDMAERVFETDGEQDDYVVAGEANLLEFAELTQADRLRQLFQAFTEKRQILHLLDQCLTGQGVQIFIGEESGYKLLDECSVVTAPYRVEGKVFGVLGVIGPTRMSYERVIPIVDITAKLLSAALNQRN